MSIVAQQHPHLSKEQVDTLVKMINESDVEFADRDESPTTSDAMAHARQLVTVQFYQSMMLARFADFAKDLSETKDRVKKVHKDMAVVKTSVQKKKVATKRKLPEIEESDAEAPEAGGGESVPKKAKKASEVSAGESSEEVEEEDDGNSEKEAPTKVLDFAWGEPAPLKGAALKGKGKK
jgi:hypothetical protein